MISRARGPRTKQNGKKAASPAEEGRWSAEDAVSDGPEGRNEEDSASETDAAGAAEPTEIEAGPPSEEGSARAEAIPVPAEEEELPRLTGERLRACLEAILFAAPDPVSRRRLYRLLPEADKSEIRDALLELEGELLSTHRGYQLVEEAAGFRLLTKPEFAPFVARLRGEKRRIRLSAAAFETLAVIAYRQPTRRADLEAIRGVQSGGTLKNLMEWNLIRVVGHDHSPGRPLLYGTTSEFLELLGFSSLDELPEPERLRERGEDRGLEVLDRIIEEGGGAPEVGETIPAEGPPSDPAEAGAEDAAEDAAEDEAERRGAAAEIGAAPADDPEEFDLDLDEED